MMTLIHRAVCVACTHAIGIWGFNFKSCAVMKSCFFYLTQDQVIVVEQELQQWPVGVDHIFISCRFRSNSGHLSPAGD